VDPVKHSGAFSHNLLEEFKLYPDGQLIVLAISHRSRPLFKTPPEEQVVGLAHALRAASYENPVGQEYAGVI